MGKGEKEKMRGGEGKKEKRGEGSGGKRKEDRREKVGGRFGAK